MEFFRSRQEHFCFKLPSNLLLARSKKLENCEFVSCKCYNIHLGRNPLT